MKPSISYAIYFLLSKRTIKGNDCWIFNGSKCGGKYGQIIFENRKLMVHRFVAYLCLGFDLNSPLDVMHKCDTPSCFNPLHLKIVSHLENMRDMANKDRHHRLKVCQRGHLMTPENSYYRASGSRACKACMRERDKINPGHR